LPNCNIVIERPSYEGIYQIASFLPHYLFASSKENDAANYTNRSPYPMLHILREESVIRAVDSHPEPIKFLKEICVCKKKRIGLHADIIHREK
jgi:hypothetical protein